MPPWAQLLRLALWPLQGWMGPAGPMERALLWGSAVVLFGISVLVRSEEAGLEARPGTREAGCLPGGNCRPPAMLSAT